MSNAPSKRQAWLAALRPHTLTVGAPPQRGGAAGAAPLGGFAAPSALLALGGALLLQIGSNLANDVYDAEKGADTDERLGPPRAVSSGWLTAREVKGAMAGALAAAFVLGVALTALAGWPILAIGLAGMVSAVAYTAGPFPLGYHGLGDLFVFVFFGLAAVAGTTFAQTGSWEPVALALGAALGCFGSGVLTVNNIRDLDTDIVAGKRTLAVRLGRRGARAWYAAVLGAPFAIVAALVAGGRLGPAGLAVGLVLPPAWRLVTLVHTRRDGPSLNRALAGTAKLQAGFGLLVALGALAS